MRSPRTLLALGLLSLLPLLRAPNLIAQGTTVPRDSLQEWLDSLAHDPNGVNLTVAEVRRGPQVIASEEKVAGSVAAWHGDLDVHGTVNGNAVAIGGDVILRPGAQIHGDAVAVGGEVRDEGGRVDGEMRSLSGLTVGRLGAPPQTPAQATRRAVSLAFGWYLVLLCIGLLVVLFARRNLEAIADRVREDFPRSFLYGMLGQVALLPALVIGIIALAITVVGIVLIPFAIVALVLATAGALALGFLALAAVTGNAAMRRYASTPPNRSTTLIQCLLLGLSLYFFLWLLGAVFTWAGALGGFLKFVATVITWVAVTVGFGATILARGGTRARPIAPGGGHPPVEDYVWQTPTPVGGVVAARRPSPPTSTPLRPREP